MSETADNLLSPSQSKGGLKYELILEKPSNETPPKVVGRPLDQPKQLSAEVIEAKLKEAEERRKSFEAQKILQAKERFSHVSELKDKRSEIEEQKIELTRQSLEKKMEASKENRETHIKAIQEKQKEHDRRVDEVRKQVDDTHICSDSLKSRLESKLRNAQKNRELIVKDILERLKEHKTRINRVNASHRDGQLAKESRCCSRPHCKQIAIANEKRSQFLKTRTDRLKTNYGEKVAEVVKRKSEVVPDSGNAVQ